MVVLDKYNAKVESLSDKGALNLLRELILSEVKLANKLISLGVQKDCILGIWAQKYIKDGEVKMELSSKGVRSLLALTLQSQNDIKNYIEKYKNSCKDSNDENTDFYYFSYEESVNSRVRFHLVKDELVGQSL